MSGRSGAVVVFILKMCWPGLEIPDKEVKLECLIERCGLRGATSHKPAGRVMGCAKGSAASTSSTSFSYPQQSTPYTVKKGKPNGL